MEVRAISDKTWKKFERWVGEHIFGGARRNMGSGAVNTRDDGTARTGDVIHDEYEIECKCYKSIAIFRWWEKLKGEAKQSGKLPVLIMREKGNRKDVLVAVHYEDFNKMKEAYEKSNKEVK